VSARLLEGGPVAARIKQSVVDKLMGIPLGRRPKLTAVLVGDDPGAKFYARSQAKGCEEVSLRYELVELPADISEGDLVLKLRELNNDDDVTGIILMMPVPEHIDGRAMQGLIDPLKDVDGVHPVNLGHVVQGKMDLAPCTAQAIIELLDEAEVDYYGAEVVIVGHSEIVGKPTALLLLDRFATTTVCHIGTSDKGMLAHHTREADILIVAVGVAGLITKEHIKPGAIVIDVGTNRQKDPETGKTRIVGDVVAADAMEVAGMVTPVPGGVGVVTSAILLRNLVTCAELQGKV